MKKPATQSLQASDFIMAIQEMGTYIDVSVDDLMLIHQKAEKFASMRNRETVLVRELMTHPVQTVRTDSTLAAAAHIMVTNKVSGLPVVDNDNKIVGIITEADFLRALGVPSHHTNHSVWQTLENMFSHITELPEPNGVVADLMVTNVTTIDPQQTLHQVLDVMKKNKIKRVVVCDDARHVIGMITRSDLVRIFFDRFKSVKNDSKKV